MPVMTGSTTLLDHMEAPGGQQPFALGMDGRRDGWGARRPLPHIHDITSVTIDIDAHLPIERVLQQAETYLRQAESSKTFNRPDLALKDYLRASIILTDVLKRNKGWVSLQRDNKAQVDRYQRLMHQVAATHSQFEELKEFIKRDNEITGVLPTSRGVATNGAPHDTVAQGSHPQARIQNGDGSSPRYAHGTTPAQTKENGAPARPAPPTPKAKPVVHPKQPTVASPTPSVSVRTPAQ